MAKDKGASPMVSPVKLPPFQSVGPGNIAICPVPTGPSYHGFMVRVRHNPGAGMVDMTPADMETHIQEIRLILDGRTKIELTGAELRYLNTYYGLTGIAGVLRLVFARPWARLPAVEYAMRYGTLDVRAASLEIKLSESVVSPTLEAYAYQGTSERLGRHIEIRRYAQTYAGAGGEHDISDIPREPGMAIAAMHMGTSKCSAVKVLGNNTEVFNADRVVVNAYNGMYGRNIQTDYFPVDFVANNRHDTAIPAALFTDFRTRLTMTGAEPSFWVLAERVVGI